MRRASRRILLAAAMLAAPLALAPARACTISAVAVAFGTYNPQSGTADDSTGTINLACPTNSNSVIIALSAGSSLSFNPRAMKNGASTLNYNLYTTTTRNIVWGDGTGGTVTRTLSGGSVSGGTRNYTATVFGRIPALQNVAAGAYGDTITVTVTF
jgi:spore coat protein U-like protein